MAEERDISNRDYPEEVTKLIEAFKAKFEAGTSSSDGFITFSQMEMMLCELRHNTSELYLDLFEDMLRNVDESELIRKKNRIQKSRD